MAAERQTLDAGAASGAVAGLVAITPAAGFVGVVGAIVIGLLAGVVCLWGVNGLKRMLGVDDSLDVFGVHGIGGMLGAILTGVFAAPSLGGTGVYDYVANKVGDYDMMAQVISQCWGVGTVIVWSGVVSFVAFKLVDVVIGLRVPEERRARGSGHHLAARPRTTTGFPPGGTLPFGHLRVPDFYQAGFTVAHPH